MKAIYSSKLYIASSRKSRINAALVAPGNFSLVQQLADDLDEEYKTPENLGTPEQSEKSSEAKGEDSLFVDEDIDPSKDLMTVDDLGPKSSSGSHISSHPSAPSSKPEGEPNEKPEGGHEDTDQLIPESPANEKPSAKEEPAEASTKITSSTKVTIDRTQPTIDLNVLKGTLNARQDLTGVSRISEKESELWIYYSDNINLNDIMTNVIEFLLLSGYTYLEFNRLARSDNAMVFVINPQTVTIPSKTIEESQEGGTK